MTMADALGWLYGAAAFVPHGYCLLWRPDLVALHAISDAVTALAYFSIPAAILVFFWRRPDLEYPGLGGAVRCVHSGLRPKPCRRPADSLVADLRRRRADEGNHGHYLARHCPGRL